MKRPLFVCVDGPKGTGKTTLLEAVTAALRADGLKVVRLSEQKSDPSRGQTMALVNRLARAPSPALEREVCERLAESRAWISRTLLPRQPVDSIVLIDRWYPSDAAFRRLLPFAEILRINLQRGVQVPDLIVALTTAPEVSWARAMARARGLGSTVLHRFEAQRACTDAFERAAAAHGWLLVRNEGPLQEAVGQVVAHLHARLQQREHAAD